ncbi:MAG: pyridoxamine 5'-phosphate oxidase family protein [Candidatus Aureabacteria bacterium]|nr:pyridoxamine 5'-phosphate oxidase family protein [Candidatus Auribacterota bacterium]
MKLKKEIISFLGKQGFTVVSTMGPDGYPHSACKGIVRIEEEKIYLIDLYTGRTRANLKNNPRMSITAVDEHSFRGFCIKGAAREIGENEIPQNMIDDWKKKLHSRITTRIVNSVRGQKGHPGHPEALMPGPKYIIEVNVEKIIDLAPVKDNSEG